MLKIFRNFISQLNNVFFKKTTTFLSIIIVYFSIIKTQIFYDYFFKFYIFYLYKLVIYILYTLKHIVIAPLIGTTLFMLFITSELVICVEIINYYIIYKMPEILLNISHLFIANFFFLVKNYIETQNFDCIYVNILIYSYNFVHITNVLLIKFLQLTKYYLPFMYFSNTALILINNINFYISYNLFLLKLTFPNLNYIRWFNDENTVINIIYNTNTLHNLIIFTCLDKIYSITNTYFYIIYIQSLIDLLNFLWYLRVASILHTLDLITKLEYLLYFILNSIYFNLNNYLLVTNITIKLTINNIYYTLQYLYNFIIVINSIIFSFIFNFIKQNLNFVFFIKFCVTEVIVIIISLYIFKNLSILSKFNLVKTSILSFTLVFLVFNLFNLSAWFIFIFLTEIMSTFIIFVLSNNFFKKKKKFNNRYVIFLPLLFINNTIILIPEWFNFYSSLNFKSNSNYSLFVTIFLQNSTVFYIIFIIWLLTFFALLILCYIIIKKSENVLNFLYNLKTLINKLNNNLLVSIKNFISKWL